MLLFLFISFVFSWWCRFPPCRKWRIGDGTILNDTFISTTGNLQVTWEKDACAESGSEKGSICPVFSFELMKDGAETGRSITMSWNSVTEYGKDGEPATLEISGFGSYDKSISSIPDDFTATFGAIVGGSIVEMETSLAFIEDAIIAHCKDSESYDACYSMAEKYINDVLGNDNWKKTKLYALHYIAGSTIDVDYGTNNSISVSSGEFKMSFIVENWPFKEGNSLKISLRFTAKNIGSDVTVSKDEDEDYHIITAKSNIGSFNMYFIKTAAVGAANTSTEEKTLSPVTLEIDDQINNGYIDVIIGLPKCQSHDNCEIEYDPSFTIEESGDEDQKDDNDDNDENSDDDEGKGMSVLVNLFALCTFFLALLLF